MEFEIFGLKGVDAYITLFFVVFFCAIVLGGGVWILKEYVRHRRVLREKKPKLP